jgi:hypothetical protein
MAPTIDWMMRPTRTEDVEPVAMRLVMATRLAVLCQRREVDPLPLLTQRVGCQRTAIGLMHLVAVTGSAWPEAFSLSPPCCRTLSHDEALLAAMAEAVLVDDRRVFDAAARDLIGEDSRDFLWREIGLVMSKSRAV